MDIDQNYGIRDKVVPKGRLDFWEIKTEWGVMVAWKHLPKQPKFSSNKSQQFLNEVITDIDTLKEQLLLQLRVDSSVPD